jgi:nucleotide-binding universal stress UspA family protein
MKMAKRFVSLGLRFGNPLQLRHSGGSVSGRTAAAGLDRLSGRGLMQEPGLLSVNEHDLHSTPAFEKSPHARIICPTDFSIHAAEALDVAVALAQQIPASIILVHVVEPKRAWPKFDATKVKVRRTFRVKLAKEAARARQQGISVQEEFLQGSPSAKIAELAVQAGADLIVMSSLGPGALKWWLVGSVAVQTMRSSPVPVMVVQNREALLARAGGARRLRVLIGYDFPAGATSAKRWARNILGASPCFHASTPLLRPFPREIAEPTPCAGATTLRSWEIPEYYPTQVSDGELSAELFYVRIQPKWCSVGTKLAKIANAIQAGLVVVATEERSTLGRFWFGSAAREILQEIFNTSVVWVPPGSNIKRMPPPTAKVVAALGGAIQGPAIAASGL